MDAAVKQEARRMLDILPDDVTWEQIIEAIYERLAIEAGLRDVEAGRVVTSSEVRREFGLQP